MPRLLLLLLLPLTSFCQNTLTQAEQLEDLEFLRGALSEMHPSFGRYTEGAQIDQHIDSLKTLIENGSLKFPFRLEVAKVVSQMHCIHTSLLGSRVKKKNRVKPRFLPLNFFWDGEALWVNESHFDSLNQLIGYQVDSINHISVSDIMKQLLVYRSGDGVGQSFQYAFINYRFNFSTLFRSFYQPDTLVPMHFSLPIGKKLEKDIPYTNFTIPRKNRKKQKPIYQTKNREFYIDSVMQFGILRIASFNPPKKSRKFYKNVIRYLNEHEVKELVIDLRDNTGGNIKEAERLISYLIDTTMFYTLEKQRTRLGRYGTFLSNWYMIANFFKRKVFSFDRRYRENGTFIIEQKRKSNRKFHFQGQIIVLQNGLTSSSSTVVSSWLKEHGEATVIGQESGGGAYGNNGLFYATSVLPNSRIKVRMPQYWLNYHLGEDRGRGVMPHIEIDYRIQDVMLERDLEMEQARRMITKNRSL